VAASAKKIHKRICSEDFVASHTLCSFRTSNSSFASIEASKWIIANRCACSPARSRQKRSRVIAKTVSESLNDGMRSACRALSLSGGGIGGLLFGRRVGSGFVLGLLVYPAISLSSLARPQVERLD
jgi:hypothetical protein